MEFKIKLKDYNGSIGAEYSPDSYAESGVYEVNGFIIFVNKSTNMIWSVNSNDFRNCAEEVGSDTEVIEGVVESNNMVSEDLLIRALLASNNGSKYLDKVNKDKL